MSKPAAYKSLNKNANRKLFKLRAFGFLSLLWERLTKHFFRPLFWILIFFTIWLFGLTNYFSLNTQWIASIVFYAVLVFLIIKDVRTFHLPRTNDIYRRLEETTEIPHRPLNAITDTLSNPDKEITQRLWQDRQTQLETLLDNFKTFAPRATLSKTDPYGARFLILLLAFASFIYAGNSWQEKLLKGLMPPVTSLAANETPYTLWLTPPDYTKQKQLILQNSVSKDMPLALPAGTKLKLIYKKRFPIGKPLLHAAGETYPLERIDASNTYAIEMKLPEGEKFSISEMFVARGVWHYLIREDHPPSIEIAQTPKTLSNAALQFFFKLHDDYGVKDITMHMELSPDVKETILGSPIREMRSVMSPSNAEFHFAPVYDLTAHPWAGMPVIFTFTARDHIEQAETTFPITINLPERKFTHPAAKALIETRKKLARTPMDLNTYKIYSTEIEDILIHPDYYQGDFKVFLALRSASARLFHADRASEETALSVISLLWDVALKLEDGDLSLSARELRKAQNALERALANPESTEEEISKLMAELREKMANYMQEMQMEIQRRMANGEIPENMPMPQNMGRIINPETLEAMLQKMEEDMRSGNKDQAREMLSRLQNMLDMMNPSMQMAMPQDMQMMQKSINQLSQIIKKQKQLKRETEEMANQQFSLQQTPMTSTAMQAQQESLRKDLGNAMLEADKILKKIPDNMGSAEQAMRGAGNMLGQGQPNAAVPHQREAIRQLEQAQQQLSQQLAQRFSQMTGFAMNGGRFDPLGRPYGKRTDSNGQHGGYVEIPAHGEVKRAQEILKLLRERSGELSRSHDELDYFRRLLRRF